MLKEMICDSFGNTKRIIFREGLNIVQGYSGNSIGKSTFLKIVDFVFGGDYYIKSNKDVVEQVKDHTIYFVHKFGNESYYFARSTSAPKEVTKCDKDFKELAKFSVTDFNNFLLEKYHLADRDSNWRSLVSLYSRIWKKENKEVDHPLYSFRSQKTDEAIMTFIKLFNLHHDVNLLQKRKKALDDEGDAWNTAEKYSLVSIPAKASDIVKFEKEAAKIENSIQILRKSILMTSVDSFENLEIKLADLFKTKKNLLAIQGRLVREISRIREDSSSQAFQKPIVFEELVSLFPNINIERLLEVETFHNKISDNLKTELQVELLRLNKLYEEVQKEITTINNLITELTSLPTTAQESLNKIIDLSRQLDRINLTASMYNKHKELSKQRVATKKELDKSLVLITQHIAQLVNEKIMQLCLKIDSANNEAPELFLSPHQYRYGVANNTGTGKAYTDLILFDLAVLSLTDLPILIHDSFLFNNINDRTIEDFILLYSEFKDKQVFISLDKMILADDKILDRILYNQTVIALNEKNMLFGKDWRSSIKNP